MYTPRFELRSFDALPLPVRCGRVLDLLWSLIHINVAILKVFPQTPMLADAGIVYRFQGEVLDNHAPVPCDGFDQDAWQDILRTREVGKGSCNDLTAWRVAELLARGIDPLAAPYVKSQELTHPDGSPFTVYHAITKRNGGQYFEDWARILGMPG